MSRALVAEHVARMKKQIEDGNFGTTVDADDVLKLIESHENLRSAYTGACASAAGHAYAGAMAEGGEEITQQELERERADHAATRAVKSRMADFLNRLGRDDLVAEAEEGQ